MNPTFRDAIFKATFRQPQGAEEFELSLRSRLNLRHRYDSARLCLGRSLMERSPLQQVQAKSPSNEKPLPGELLFGGDDFDIWMSLLLLSGDFQEGGSTDAFRHLTEAHWERGVRLLQDLWKETQGDPTRFVSRLAALLPEEAANVAGSGETLMVSTGAVSLKIGPNVESGEEIGWVLNGSGTSPHVVVMGASGTGKTTLGLSLATQILKSFPSAPIPVLFLDPKGDLASRLQSSGILVKDLEVGHTPIPFDLLPDQGMAENEMQMAAMSLADALSACCKGGGGEKQKTRLVSAVVQAARAKERKGLHGILEAYQDLALQTGDKGADAIASTLDRLTRLTIFSPQGQTPAEFFSQSWVVRMNRLESDDLRNGVMLLLLDALKRFAVAQPEAPIQDGMTGLRHLLFVDEAERILKAKGARSIDALLRQGRSKGHAVMLMSQNPGDFQTQDHDLLAQVSAFAIFACKAADGLKLLEGPFGRKIMPNELAEQRLSRGVALVKVPNHLVARAKCWG